MRIPTSQSFFAGFSWLIKNWVTDVLLFLDIVCVASVGLVLLGCVLFYLNFMCALWFD